MKKKINIAYLSAWMVFVVALLVISVVRDNISSLFGKLSSRQKVKKRSYKRATMPRNYVITQRRQLLA